MTKELHNLTESLSILGKESHLSLSQRQKVRDQLFKKIGQANLLEAVQTQTEVDGLIMPVGRLQSIFQPRRISLGMPATLGIMSAVFIGTLGTGAMAKDAKPGEGLYGLRKTIEAVQIALTPDPIAKAQVKLSIARDLVQDSTNVSPTVVGPKLETVLAESQKAIDSAKAAVSELKTKQPAKTDATDELTTKLAAVINTQRDLLNDIVVNKVGDERVQESILAMRNDLDTLLVDVTKPEDAADDEKKAETPADVDKDEPTDANDGDEPVTNQPDPSGTVFEPAVRETFNGNLTTLYGVPALNTSDSTYLLLSSPVDLTPYLGRSNVVISGYVTEYGLLVEKVTLDSKLIGEHRIAPEQVAPGITASPNKNNSQ